MTITRRTFFLFVAVVLLAAAGVTAVVLIGSRTETVATPPSVCADPAEQPPCVRKSAPAQVAAPTTTTTTPTRSYYTPDTSDFGVQLSVTSKKCFGTAGCSLEYSIKPEYHGAELDPSVTYTVTYEVSGGNDGVQIGSFRVTGDTASYTPEESIRTKSSKQELSVKISSVAER